MSFIKHAQSLSDSFKLVDSSCLKGDDSSPKGRSKDFKSHRKAGSIDENNKERNSKREPVGLWPPHEARSIQNGLKDCRDRLSDGKN